MNEKGKQTYLSQGIIIQTNELIYFSPNSKQASKQAQQAHQADERMDDDDEVYTFCISFLRRRPSEISRRRILFHVLTLNGDGC